MTRWSEHGEALYRESEVRRRVDKAVALGFVAGVVTATLMLLIGWGLS